MFFRRYDMRVSYSLSLEGNSLVSAVRAETVGGAEDKYAHVPEEFRPKVYGVHNIMPLRVGDVIMVAQSRNAPNRVRTSLGESIEEIGLLNNPDIARVEEVGFKEYVEFVNRIWGAEHRPDDYSPASDGMYYLVIAGHTRTGTIWDLAERHSAYALEHGYQIDPADTVIECKIYDAPDPATILSIQLDENLHERVPEERNAVAIVESYYFGLEQGRWSDEKGFVAAAEGKFTPRQLEKALLFAQLPSEYRDAVLANGIPYAVAVEVSSLAIDHRSYVLQDHHGVEDVSELEEELHQDVIRICDYFIGREIALALEKGKRMNISAYRKRCQGFRASWGAALNKAEIDDGNQLFKLDMAAEQLRLWEAAKLKAYNDFRTAVSRFNNIASERSAAVMSAHLSVLERTGKSEDVAQVLEGLKDQYGEFASRIAVSGVVSANGVRDSHQESLLA
ncbi:MAG: hypothetical protein AAF413_00405 [Patescibacteria group bacterium]